MKFLIWLLVLFASAVAVTVSAHNAGYVQIVYPPYRVELSLTLLVAILLMLFVIGYFVVKLSVATLRLPHRVRTFREKRAHNKGRAAMMDAMTAFFEGRYANAEQAAVRAMELGEKSVLNPIIAARAAHELHEYDKRDIYLGEAQGKSVGEMTMRLMAKAEFLLDEKRPQSALLSLHEMSDSGIHKHVGALKLELKAQQQARNWEAVLDVVTQLEKRDAIEANIAGQLRQQAWLERMNRPDQDIAGLRSAWKAIPNEFKRRTKIATVAAQAFSRLGDTASALQILTESLNAMWEGELVILYGELHEGNGVAQIEQAERWLQVHNTDAGLLLTLGKLCMYQSLWGKAQSYLEASCSLRPSREALTALAQLAEKQDKKDEAFKYYHRAMELEFK
jgi:HemY protein